MAATVTSIPGAKKLTKIPAQVITQTTRADEQREEFDEAAATQRFKDLMLKYGGKCSFDGFID